MFVSTRRKNVEIFKIGFRKYLPHMLETFAANRLKRWVVAIEANGEATVGFV